MQRKVLLYLTTGLLIIAAIYLSEVVAEIIVNDSRLIKISLMGSFALGLIYSVILGHVFKS